MTPTQEQSRTIFFEGIGHFEAGRLAEARAAFERCRALTPERPSVLGNLGITLFHLGQRREALPLLREATAADPALTDAWACLGLAHEAAGDWAAAAVALSEAIARADRSAAWRFSQGQCLMRLGRLPEALAAFDRALALDANHAAAWSARGGLLRELHRFDAAAESFERAIALGADRELHAYYLASVRAGSAAPPTAPRQYVEGLFDDYAAEFQAHVTGPLGYRGHELLLQPIVASGQRFRAALDLGCGTGLCAPLLRACSEVVDGVDISAQMLAQARQLGLYRELVHADLNDFLATAPPRRADLVAAADVMIYVGDLGNAFRHIARILEPGGLFAFSVELATGGAELQLLPSLRYAHAEGYVRRLAAQHCFAVEHLHTAPIRHEQSRPVHGAYIQLRCNR